MKATILCTDEDIMTARMKAPAAVVAGDLVVINGMVVVVMESGAQNASVLCCYRASRVTATKNGNLAVEGGDLLYLKADATEINKTSGGNTLAGLALGPQLAADTTVEFELIPATL